MDQNAKAAKKTANTAHKSRKNTKTTKNTKSRVEAWKLQACKAATLTISKLEVGCGKAQRPKKQKHQRQEKHEKQS